MRYNLADTDEAAKAFEYLTTLNGRECEVEIKRVTKHRTLPQNAYFHLLLGVLGAEFGMNLEEMKSEFKRTIYPDMFVYRKEIPLGKNSTMTTKVYLRSSANLNSEEMTKSIDKLRTWAAEQGHSLPDADDRDGIRYIENEYEKVKHYL